ncbi:MAG: hypothetical protein L3J71_10390 [Victivallaceae bacterium]|nr:hypothetical protein [Victivallaceae bacterium]
MVTVLICVVMFAALIGMMVCSKKQKTNPNAQPIAMGLLIVVIICGVAMLYRTGILGDANAGRMASENQFTASQGIVLGQYLAANNPGKVLVIAEADFKTNVYTKTLVDGLKEGIGAGADVAVDTIEIPGAKKPTDQEDPNMPDMMMPLMDTMTAKDFDRTVANYPNAKVIVSLVGLPRDKSRMKLWKQKNGPKIALLNAYGNLANLVKAGMICAVTVSKPKADYESAYPGTPQAAFDMRYILVTTKNIAELKAKNKKLLSM